MAQTVKIKGRDVASDIYVDAAEQKFEKGPNEGNSYFRARANGRGFIVSLEFFKAWQDGDIAEVSLTESMYQVEDPLNPGQMINRDSYQLNSYSTHKQLAKITENELNLQRIERTGSKRIDLELQQLEAESLGKLNISPALMEKLKVGIEA